MDEQRYRAEENYKNCFGAGTPLLYRYWNRISHRFE
jgi:hypothetical protein